MKTRIIIAILLLATGISAAAQGTYSIQLNNTTVTVTRSGITDVEETVRYRTVSGSALEGVNFNRLDGTLTFTPGQTSKTFELSEMDPEDVAVPYCLQTSTSRQYRVEVLDMGGFVLASKDRELYYGTAYKFQHKYANTDLTDFVYFHNGNESVGPVNDSYIYRHVDISYTPPTADVETSGSLEGYVLIDDSYDYGSKPVSISTNPVIEGAVSRTRDYLKAIGNKMYATLCFVAKVKDQGYAYFQVLTGNSTASYDNTADPYGEVDDPVNSIYKACFEYYKGTTNTPPVRVIIPHRYDYHNIQEGVTAGKYSFWEHDQNYSLYSDFYRVENYLYQQKFRLNSYRASDAAAFVFDPTVTDLTVRFDAGGKDNDTYGFKDLFFRMALLDKNVPQLQSIQVNPGFHRRGNPFYITLVFDEIISAQFLDGFNVFDTSWGPLRYLSGDGTNVLTFGGVVSGYSPVGTVLEITGLCSNLDYTNLRIKDMAGNLFTGPVAKTFTGVAIDENYNFSISYVPNGGTMPASYPTSYNYDTASTNLPTPTCEGKLFVGWFDNPSFSGSPIVSFSNFSMTGNKVFYAKWDDDFTYGHAGTAEDPYLISTTRELDLFAAAVRNGSNDYSGKFIKLANNLTYTHGSSSTENNFSSIGANARPFRGTFDGDGHTISGIRIYGNYAMVGLFGCVEGEVKNLVLADARISGTQQVGGIAGNNAGTILNCRVANNVYVKSIDSQCGWVGGIVGYNTGGRVSGCLSRATIQKTGSSGFGGIVGINNDDGIIENCFVRGADIPSSPESGAIVGNSLSGTLSNNYYINCYKDSSSATDFGCEGSDISGARSGRSIATEAGITATPLASATEYTTSGITAYGTTSLRYNGNLYSGASVNVGLSLSHDPAPDGYLFTGYKVAAGTLSGNDTDGYTLNVPADNVTIKGYEVDLSQLWGSDSDGSQEHPYTLYNIEGWNLLSQEVAGGKSFSGKYFRMGADIGPVTTMVGTEVTPFGGVFNGNGHTLTVDLTETNIQYYAPFHYINGATLQNLRVDGAILTNKQNAGGIVGYISGSTVSITDCVSSVTITSSIASGNAYHGGMAGYKQSGTAVSFERCVFDGKLLKDGSKGGSYHGGILGSNEGGGASFTRCLVVPSEMTLYYRRVLTGSGDEPTKNACFYAYGPSGEEFSAPQGCQRVRRVILPEGISAVRSSSTPIAGGSGTIFPDGASWDGMEFYTPAVTVTLTPALGYTVTAVKYNDGSDHNVQNNGDGTWSFAMPDKDVTVTITATSATSLQIAAHQASFAGQVRYWATFYHPTWNYSLPEGAQAFTMGSDKALYRIGDGTVIPAACAVVIMADSDDITLTVTDSTATPEPGNILKGTSAATPAPAGAHVMSKVENTFGFFNYSGTIPANKAYYD